MIKSNSWKLKAHWTTKDVKTDEVIEEYKTSYSYSEFRAIFNKEEQKFLKNGSNVIWHSFFSNGKPKWIHICEPKLKK